MRWWLAAFLFSLLAGSAAAQPGGAWRPAPVVTAATAGGLATTEIASLNAATAQVNALSWKGPFRPNACGDGKDAADNQLGPYRGQLRQARTYISELIAQANALASDRRNEATLARGGWNTDAPPTGALNAALQRLATAIANAEKRIDAVPVLPCPPPKPKPRVGLNPGGLTAITPPTYEAVPPLDLPKSFCSAFDRSQFIRNRYFPYSEAIGRNAARAIDTSAALERRWRDLEYKTPNAKAAIAQAKAAFDEFQPTLAEWRAKHEAAMKLYDAIYAIPIVNCDPPRTSTWTGTLGGDPAPPPPPPPPPTFSRPQLERITVPAAPDHFCSEAEKDAYKAELLRLAQAAVENQRRIADYSTRLNAIHVEAIRKGDYVAQDAVRAEQQVARKLETEQYELYQKLTAAHKAADAIPVVDCPPKAGGAVGGVGVVPGGGGGVRPPRLEKPCPPGRKPIRVGPNNRVGSGARSQQKAANAALGVLGGVLGGGGGSDRERAGPPTVNCKIRDREMTVLNDTASGIALKVGARRSKDTVTVFAEVARSPDHGTFQTAFVETPEGGLRGPSSVGICDLWGEWNLTVSWTKTTYEDGREVRRESGGWSRSGLFEFKGDMGRGIAGLDGGEAGLWRNLGFSNAAYGARKVAMQFRMTDLTESPRNVVIHVTRPGGDPVMTTPFVMRQREGPTGLVIEPTGREDCPEAMQMGAADGALQDCSTAR
jgi:hypothetical protein